MLSSIGTAASTLGTTGPVALIESRMAAARRFSPHGIRGGPKLRFRDDGFRSPALATRERARRPPARRPLRKIRMTADVPATTLKRPDAR
jgi:hypothetical protein